MLFDIVENNDITCTIRIGEDKNLLIERKNVHIIDSEVSNVKNTIKLSNFDLLINTVCSYERGNSLIPVIMANMNYPLEIISFAIESNIKKIITIDTSLPENVNLYSLTKKTVAKVLDYYSKKNKDLLVYNIKLENFYGEDEPSDRFLHIVINKLKKNESVDLTVGTQRRDFIYIQDVIDALLYLINYKNNPGFYSISLGTGEGPTIREVIEYLSTIIGSTSKLNFGAVPSRTNEPDCIADMTYLNSIGFYIKYFYKKGLLKIV